MKSDTTENQSPAIQNKPVLNHYVNRDKRFDPNKKKQSIVMCKASYLYSYIEICHNSLISLFFSLLTNIITVNKIGDQKKKQHSILHGNCPKCNGVGIFLSLTFSFYFIFLLFFYIEGTLQQTTCAPTHQKRKKIFQKVCIDTEV